MVQCIKKCVAADMLQAATEMGAVSVKIVASRPSTKQQAAVSSAGDAAVSILISLTPRTLRMHREACTPAKYKQLESALQTCMNEILLTYTCCICSANYYFMAQMCHKNKPQNLAQTMW